MPDNQPLYIFDTSALIDMIFYYTMDVHKKYWRNCDEYAVNGQFCVPEAVYDEIKRKDDELNEWVEKFKSTLVHENSTFIYSKIEDILKKFPKLVDANRERESADPYVIALALEMRDGQRSLSQNQNIFIVSHERNTGGRTTQKKKTLISEVCDYFTVPHCMAPDIARQERWDL